MNKLNFAIGGAATVLSIFIVLILLLFGRSWFSGGAGDYSLLILFVLAIALIGWFARKRGKA